ncbi:MAG TPA: DUF4350 domain-containing protein [Planctomycetes bacterium]|nr:DUF4350 domain-containing protein [Planctomycetota bacterium]
MKKRGPLFRSPRVSRVLLLGAALASLAFSLVLASREPLPPAKKEEAHSFSKGPVGHQAFFEFLRALGVDARRFRNTAFDAPRDPLFFIEPRPESSFGGRQFSLAEALGARVQRGLPTVLVLPKWRWNKKKKAFQLLDLPAAARVLAAAFPGREGPELSRGALPGRREGKGAALVPGRAGIPDLLVDLPDPQEIRLKGFGEVLLGRPEACLAAGFPDREGPLYLVSDPDLLHNFNLHRGDHGAFWAAFVERILHPERVYVEEVFHGLGRIPSLGRALSAFPGSLLLAQGILLLLGLAWAAFHRFGPVRDPEPPRGRGPAVLVDAAGRLLAAALDEKALAHDYVEWILRDTAGRMGLPPAGDLQALARALDEAARRREIPPGAAEALAAVAEAREEGGRLAWEFRRRLLFRRGAEGE